MSRTILDPFLEGWDLFRKFSGFGCCSGRRFYTRKERLEGLEKIKTGLQQEITGIDELIKDLKAQEAKASGT